MEFVFVKLHTYQTFYNLLNQLNLSLQGRDGKFLLCQNKITLIIKKLEI